jgi:RES domain
MALGCPTAPKEAALLDVTLEELPRDTRFIRFHSPARAAVGFNPNVTHSGEPSRMERAEDGSRFNPFPGFPRTNVSTLYAGSTEHSAALESVFHDVPHTPDPTYPSQALDKFVMSTMSLTRSLKVLRLVNEQLRQISVPSRTTSLLEAELIHCSPSDYPAARTWAHYFYQSLPDIAGFAWRPRLGGEGTAYVLFGDRVSAADFSPPTTPVVRKYFVTYRQAPGNIRDAARQGSD